MSGLVDRTKHAKNPIVTGNIDRDKVRADIADLSGILREFTPRTRLPLGTVGAKLVLGGDPLETILTEYGKFADKDDRREAAISSGATKLALQKAFEKPKVGTLKQGRNTSNQTLFGVEPGKTGFFSPQQLIAAQGKIIPIDTRMAFSFDTKTGTLKQQPLSEIEKDDENKRNARQIVAAVNTVGDLKNSMIERVKNAPTGAVGSVFGVLEGISDQVSQVSQALGFNQNSLDFDVNTSEKLDKYLIDKGVTRGATEFAKLKSSVINLAYNLAKIKEPGNPRLSEGDIIRQLDRIKFGASRDVFIGALNQIYDDEVIGARGQITGYGLDPDDFFKVGKSKETTTKTGTKTKDADNDPAGIRF
jgi:hypothetical protein